MLVANETYFVFKRKSHKHIFRQTYAWKLLVENLVIKPPGKITGPYNGWICDSENTLLQSQFQ